MGRTCKKCGQQTGPNRRLCKMCSLDKRYGNDFETASDVDDEPDELEYRCVECGHEQVGTLSDECEECGGRRWRYIGPLPGEDESDHEERVATDGGTEDLIPARVDYDELIGADCPVCDEEMTPGAIRFNGRAWEHKSDEAHPQAGHHRISKPLDEDDEEQLRADGGRPSEEEMLDVELVLGAGRLYDHQVRLDVTSSTVVDREEGRLEISLADGEMDEYLAELGLKNRTDEFATDGGQPAGSPETRLGEARKQLRIVLDDVTFEDEETAEYVEGALACAESAAVCLEGEDALDGEPSITDTTPVPMVKSVGPLGTTIVGPDPAAYQAWQNRRDGGDDGE